MATRSFVDDCQPPWVVFPDLDPQELVRHLKQGTAEPWFDQVWRPFWAGLADSDKTEYLRHWGASDRWREEIRFFFDSPVIDLVADAAESERELEGFRKEQSRKRSWLSRLFGRR